MPIETAADASPPPDSDAPHQPQVEGYEILGELGRGGMGVVYRARQKSLERTVALKVLMAGQHADSGLLGRFRAEAEVVARLQHPHIVQVYEVGTTQGCPYFSLEFVAGGSLADKLNKQSLAPREAAELMRTLALAVEAAHSAGIIHRDLKPANILLALDGAPKIADFGLAKQLTGSQELTRTGDVMGTPSYMAPEQASGGNKDIGPGCDIYALGAILYELLTGGPPFRGHDPVEIVLQVISQEPVSVRRLAPKTPRDLETICLKCLAKEPKKRYPSALALANDLTSYLEGRPIEARPASAAEKGWKWARRRPALAGLIAMSILSLSTIVIYGAWKNHQLAQSLDATAKARDRAEGNLRRAIEAAARRISRASDTSANPLVEELKFLEEIRAQTGDEPTVRHERALAAGWAGYIYSELSDSPAAERAFTESTSLFAELSRQFPEEPSYRREWANFIARYAAFLAKTGDNEGAQRKYAEAVTMLEELLVAAPGDVNCRVLLSAECNNLAIVTGALGGDSEPHHLRAIQVREQLVNDFPDDRGYRYDLTVSLMNRSAGQLRRKEYAAAEEVLRECLRELTEAPQQIQVENEYRRALAAAHLNLGYALEYQQKPAEAVAAYAAGVREMEQLVETNPQSVAARSMLIDALNNLRKLLIDQGQYAEAIPPVTRAVSLYSQLAKEFPDNPDYGKLLASQTTTLNQLKRVAAGLPPE